MVLWYILAGCRCQYTISAINKSSGLFYEHVKNIKLFNSQWNLVTYTDLFHINKKLTFITNSYKVTKTLCQQKMFISSTSCKTSLIIVDKLIPNLLQKENTLKTLMSHNRVKRGWFNLVGSTFKTVFGTLDQNDAEYYNKAIDNVNENEKNLVNLLKQQVQVVQTTITNFNHTINDLNKNREFFSLNFEHLTNFTTSLNKKFIDLETQQILDEHFNLLTLLISELKNEYTNLIDTILFAKSNIVHPIVITPSQLIQELSKTLYYLKSSTTYPLPLDIHNAYKLLDIANIKYHLSQERICFVISIPIVDSLQFYLYNLIPLPTYHSSTRNFVFILPIIRYLAISDSKTLYTTFKDLNNCKSLNSDTLICENIEPIYSLNSRPICETLLLNTINSIPDSCDTRIIPGTFEIWHKLQNKNHWIYVLPKPTDITVNCINTKPINLVLNNTGILNIETNCQLYTSSTTLISDVSIHESSFNSIIPEFDILDDCCQNINQNRSNENLHLIPLQPITLDSESLNLASHKLEEINKNANKLYDSTLFEKISNNSYLVYIICTIFKVFLIYIIYRLVKNCKNRCKRKSIFRKHSHEGDCCQTVNNCLTFNFCKSDKKTETLSLEDIPVNDLNDKEDSESQSLRRSSRIAKLKDKI